MNPHPPPPPSGWPVVPPPVPAAPGRKTLVGGVPWGEEADAGPAVAVGPVMIDQREPAPGDSPFDADPLSGRSLRARFDEFVRRSPPLTVSLSLHVLVILGLALAYVRFERERRPELDLSFASAIVDEEDKGVEIPPPPEPVEEQVMEEAKTEKPPVEDPVAAPPTKAEVA
ncbi:MAG: hypothetical protein ACKOC4_12065, partial [Planctomycetia bacterium]